MRFGLGITAIFTMYVLIAGPVAILPTVSNSEKIDIGQLNSNTATHLVQKLEIAHQYGVDFERALLFFLALMVGIFTVGIASLSPKYEQFFLRFKQRQDLSEKP